MNRKGAEPRAWDGLTPSNSLAVPAELLGLLSFTLRGAPVSHVTLHIGLGKQLAFYSECHGKLMDGFEQEVM